MQQKCEELSANLRKETEASDVLEQSLAKAQAGSVGSIDLSLSRDVPRLRRARVRRLDDQVQAQEFLASRRSSSV